MSDIFEKLASPFDPSEVDWRVGSTNGDKTKGMALAYIDARTVMDRLDAVCGPAGWQCRYVMEGTKTVCELAIKCGDEWVWKSDGAGDSDVEAEKGALSDAFKRAAVRWGVGRYLYNLKTPWVALEQRGKSYIIHPDEMPKLSAMLRGNKPTPPPPDEYESDLAKSKTWLKAAIPVIEAKTSIQALDLWMQRNQGPLDKLQNVNGDGYKEVMKALLQKRSQLENMKDAAE